MEKIKVFTSSFLGQLVQRLQSKEIVQLYVDGRSPSYSILEAKDTQLSIDSFPDLNAGNGEFENARILYETFKELDRTLASDYRLWAWLAHVPFMEYMSKRWPVQQQPEEKRAEYIVRHWFLDTQGATAYMRHGIAMLWWGADTTYDPVRENPFELTRELFSMQDYTRTLFGTLGRSTNFAQGVLEFVVENPELFDSHKEAKVRFLMRRLNYAGGYKVLPSLSKMEIKKFLENYVNAIKQVVE